MGGDCLSKKEFRVEEDWLTCGWSSLPPSLLEVLPDEPLVSLVLKEPLERRRRSRRSLRKDGIAGAGGGGTEVDSGCEDLLARVCTPATLIDCSSRDEVGCGGVASAARRR